MAFKKKRTVIDVPPTDKDGALAMALDGLKKEYGKGIITTLNDSSMFTDIDRISSGSVGLDWALSGGYAKGRIVEITGLESSGKTTITLHAIAECQKSGGRCAFIDAEHSFCMDYAKSIGVNVDTLLFSQPNSCEEALNVASTLSKSGALDLIVVDSVSALVPQAELEKNIGESTIGLQARIMSQAMRMLVGPSFKTNTLIIFINQIRMMINVMFGNPETTSGGNALKFYASQRIDIRRVTTLLDKEEKIGIRSRVKVVKSKVGPPFRQAEFNIIFGKGIDVSTELLELGSNLGIIERSGPWYSYGDLRIGQGTSNAAEYLNEHLELREEIKDKIIKTQFPVSETD